MLTAHAGVALTDSSVDSPRPRFSREHRYAMSLGGALSLALHLLLLAIVLNSDGRFGDFERLPVFLVQWIDEPRKTDEVREATPEATSDTSLRQQTEPPSTAAAPRLSEALVADAAAMRRFDPASIQSPLAAFDIEEASDSTPPVEDSSVPAPPPEPKKSEPRRFELAPLQQLAIQQRVLDAMQALHDGTSSEATWTEDGREFHAKVIRDPSIGSMELEQVSVDVSTSSASGTPMRTQLTLKRLAFSQFSQIIDRWDPQVQLHDDEIVGRFHSNSPFYVAATADAVPKFAGKVTTAARGFRVGTGNARRRQGEMFQGGLQTFTGRIELPKEARPFFGEPVENASHVKTFTEDAHITFEAGGRYRWRDRSDVEHVGTYDADDPAYFVSTNGAGLYVQGVIDGKVLVYSPERIVIEGSLRYATDPRVDSDSDDFLGLVADKYVEIARPYVTGRGDLTIEAAIFARRRFIVRDIDYHRTALMSIYGSLTAGSISATEPRYATKIEFDPRFDRLRPPGFPATNRYEVAKGPEAWTEIE